MSCVYLGLPRDLNVSNRRMRTRMSGGVAGDGRAAPGRPYADSRSDAAVPAEPMSGMPPRRRRSNRSLGSLKSRWWCANRDE